MGRRIQSKIAFGLLILIAGAFLGFNSFLNMSEVDSWCEESKVVEGYYKGIAVETEDRMDEQDEATVISATNTMRGERTRKTGSHYESYFAVESWNKSSQVQTVLERENIDHISVKEVRMSDDLPSFKDVLDEGSENLSSLGISESDQIVDTWKEAFYLKLDGDANTEKVSEELERNLSEYTDWPLSVESYCR